jgi:hypothetical protein
MSKLQPLITHIWIAGEFDEITVAPLAHRDSTEVTTNQNIGTKSNAANSNQS